MIISNISLLSGSMISEVASAAWICACAPLREVVLSLAYRNNPKAEWGLWMDNVHSEFSMVFQMEEKMQIGVWRVVLLVAWSEPEQIFHFALALDFELKRVGMAMHRISKVLVAFQPNIPFKRIQMSSGNLSSPVKLQILHGTLAKDLKCAFQHIYFLFMSHFFTVYTTV